MANERDLIDVLQDAFVSEWTKKKAESEQAAHDYGVAIEAVALFVDELKKRAQAIMAEAAGAAAAKTSEPGESAGGGSDPVSN